MLGMIQYLVSYALMNIDREDEGQGLVEYALIISLIAVACIVAIGVLSGAIQDVLEGISFDAV